MRVNMRCTAMHATKQAIGLLLGAVYLPFLQAVFDTVPLGTREWTVVLPLLLVPGVAAEVTKAIMRARIRRRMAVATV